MQTLPLRHHFIEGDVLWTEGHRLSWRMMLRGQCLYSYLNQRLKSKERGLYDYRKRQPVMIQNLATKPDFIWQYCQYIKKFNGKKILQYL